MVEKKIVNFEKNLEKLETVAQELDKQDLTLDQSLALFEKGMTLVKTCEDQLASAEKRIEIIMEKKN